MKRLSFFLRQRKWAIRLTYGITLATLNHAYANCAVDDPKTVAESFFEKHAHFASENPSKIKAVVTPRFFDAMEREYKCAQGDECAIEIDPWTDAQDGHIGKPIVFATVSNSGVEATVSMTYPFILEKKREQKSATFILQRSSPNECWRLGDLKGPLGQSLLLDVEQWHNEYGKEP